ncbi:uncharacterized protein LOC111434807 [Cucurbita moschata]|uniref:Uncharacterized protein LOC111434807 n=1 Tax=Cucurbita moschata TaxID=3662 RepID=A0A6J1EIL6_CUCMO|nr:uncharacterized protein LOC111434807 [Cucurbita moschata]
MQRDFLGREKRMWVAGLPFFIKKSENPQGTTLRMICEEVWPRPQPEGGDPRVVRERNHVDPIYGSKDIKIGKEGCVSVFRGQRRKEKKKEERSRPASGGWWRQAPDGCDRRRTRVDHRLEQRSSSDASTRVARKPGRIATRAEPTRDYAEAGARGRRAACDWRLPARVATHSQCAAGA